MGSQGPARATLTVEVKHTESVIEGMRNNGLLQDLLLINEISLKLGKF